MLDKKVVKYTRNGIQQLNLATGETQMLTQSKLAKEQKYDPGNKETVYGGGAKEKPSPSASKAVPGRKIAKQNEETAQQSKKAKQPVQYTRGQQYHYRHDRHGSGGAYAFGQNESDLEISDVSIKAEPARIPATRKNTDSSETERNPSLNDRIFFTNTTSEFLSGGADSSSYRRHLLRSAVLRAGEDFSEDLEENDNLGLSSAGIYGKFGYRYTRGIQSFSNLQQQRRYSSSVKYSQKVGRAVASRARSSVGSVKKSGKAAPAVAKALAHPANWKIIAVIAGILLVLYFITQITGSFASSIVGSTTEHPDLTNYVMQLDTDFQTKVADTISSYRSKSDTTVTVEGSNVINTDANALAILVTEDWTDIQMNEQNKNRLRDAHGILNSFSVSDKESTVTKTTNDGQTITKTVHKVTVYINTFTAKSKIDAFGFNGEKKSHVLEMLVLLDQIDNVNQRNVTPAPGGGSPGASFDDPQVKALITEAENYLGYPYLWGGSTPATSFDCSGFVSWVYTHSGVHNLPRTTAQGIFNQCTVVSPSDAKPGDLVFFKGTYPTSNTVTHIGIYVGNGRMLHCGDPIQYTSLNKTYWQQHFYAYGRLK